MHISIDISATNVVELEARKIPQLKTHLIPFPKRSWTELFTGT